MTEPQPQPHGDWRRLLDVWREDILVSLVSLTRIPVKLSFEITAARRARALRADSIIGLGIGAAGAVVYAIAAAFGLPPLPAGLIAIGAVVLLTGAVHEDGLADVTDGFGTGRTVEHKLEIMRDHRVGTSGVIALVLSVVLRAGAVAALAEPGLVALALLAAGAVSRGFVPAVMRMLEPIAGGGDDVTAATPTAETTVIAAAIGAAAALICLGLAPGGAAFVASAGAVIVMAAIAFRQIGGHTDDVLGACQQVGEIVLLLAAATHAGA